MVTIRPASVARVAGDLRIPVRATIRNLSANGLLVHAEQQLQPGNQLEFVFRTPGGAELNMRADVRHVQHLQVESQELWEVGCEYRESHTASRDHIVRFVLDHHRALSAPPLSLAG